MERRHRREGQGITTARDWVLSVCAYVVLPNLPFLAIALFIPIHREIIDLDYLVIGILCVLCERDSLLRWILIVLALVMDLIRTVGSVYYFDFWTALRHVRDLAELAPGYYVTRLGGTLLLMLLFAAAIERVGRTGQRSRALTLSVVLLVLASVSILLRPAINFHGYRTRLLDSAATRAAHQIYTFFRPVHQSPLQAQGVAPVVVSQMVGAEDPRINHVVVILVESLGQAESASLTDSILGPLLSDQTRQRYEIFRGTVPFGGATEQGEMRTLCGLLIHPDAITEYKDVASYCLPGWMRQKGYETYGIHGFSGDMFHRTSWWPTIGLEHLLFRDQLRDLPQCGDVFPGACDPAIALAIERLLAGGKDQKQFIYWLTLNSHLPINKPPDGQPVFNCKLYPNLPSDVCNQSKTLYQLTSAVAALAMSNRIPPTTFVLVGDHAPPFLNYSARELYDQTKVPFVVMLPRRAPGVPDEVNHLALSEEFQNSSRAIQEE